MKKDRTPTQESFDALLSWLDPDREVAGQKYEELRRRLVKLFVCRGCAEAESLADDTIDRVIWKLPEIRETYVGEPARYFYAVANKIYLEYLRTRPAPPPPPPTADPGDSELEFHCLEQCMERLTPKNRQLVLRYYQDERRAKIDHRKRLAEELGVAINALRIRAHRIRAALQVCVENCLREATV
jgi:DNA-directed RNA polymerase specialized sigma24 family protein